MRLKRQAGLGIQKVSSRGQGKPMKTIKQGKGHRCVSESSFHHKIEKNGRRRD